MIKDNNNYLYLIVPNEYRCVYYNILDTLGTLGEDLLSSCTATCKGRAISGFACYNMFIAACAAYYLGQIKKARVLISYIKAQLEINCDKILIFEDSLNDEWIYLTVPKAYQCVFEKLLNKLATWGQELLDDCTVSCKGQNKNILNAWNLFNAACIAYDTSAITKSKYIVDYIKGLLGFNCPDEEDEYNTPVLKNFALTVKYNENTPTIEITRATVSYEHENNLVENSLKLVNYDDTDEVLASNLPISRIIDLDITDYGGVPGVTVSFVLEATDIKGAVIRSNIFNVTIPDVQPEDYPTLEITRVNTSSDESYCDVNGLVATCDKPDKFNANGLSVYIKEGNGGYELIQGNITPQNSMNIEFDAIPVYSIGSDGLSLTVKLAGTGKDNINYSDTFDVFVPGDGGGAEPDDPAEPGEPDNPNPEDPGEPADPTEPEPDNPDEPGVEIDANESSNPDNQGNNGNAEPADPIENGGNSNPEEDVEQGD